MAISTNGANRKPICRILCLFAMCSLLINGMLAQSIADIARQERAKRKEREQKQPAQEKAQQEPEKKRPVKTSSTPKVHSNENGPDEGLSAPMPLSSPLPLVPPGASSDVSPNALPHASPTRNRVISPAYLLYLLLRFLGYGLALAGGLWMLVVSFKTSIWWGLGCLFLPVVQLVYVILFWKEAKRAFWVQVGATVVIVIAVVVQVAGS